MNAPGDRTPLLSSLRLYSTSPAYDELNSGTDDNDTPRITRHPSVEIMAETATHFTTSMAFSGVVRELSRHINSPKKPSNRRGGECCLCIENKSTGVHCKENHFICRDECFATFISCVCEETYKLKQSKGRITCPYPDCKSSPWTSREVREGLEGHCHASDIYTEALLSLLDYDLEGGGDIALTAQLSVPESLEGKHERLKEMICDALTFKCPNPMCRLALDPNPDGCCSMKCLKCGMNFCWLCFTVTGMDSGASHHHVQKCSENPMPDNLFVSKTLVDKVHTRRRLEAIRRSLLSAEGNGWQSSDTCRAAVQAVSSVLQDSDITQEAVFRSTEIAPPVPAETLAAGGMGAVEGAPGVRPMNPTNVALVLCGDFLSGLLGVYFNYHDIDVSIFSHRVVKEALIYCLMMAFVVMGVTFTYFRVVNPGEPGRALLWGLVFPVVFLLFGGMVTAYAVVVSEGTFFALDFFMAHVTGGSLKGVGYWHTESLPTGLIPSLSYGYISTPTCHIVLVTVSAVSRVLVSVYQARLEEVQKNFAKTTLSTLIIVFTLALFRDYGIDHTRLVLDHWGFMFLGMILWNMM